MGLFKSIGKAVGGITGILAGGSKSSSKQKQTSDSFGGSTNRATSSSASGGFSRSVSGGLSGSQGRSGSSDSVFSADLLRQLYGDALNTAGSIDPGVASGRVDQLFTGGLSILDRLGEGGAGEDYLSRRLADDNGAVLNGQIDALGADLGRFFNDQLNPAIQGSAVAAGQLGGGRQGVAQAGAAESVLREFSTGAANLRAADITQRDSAALGLLSAQNERGATSLGGLDLLRGIGTTDTSLDPYRALGEIFGGPVALTDSFGQESSFGQEFSESEASQYATSLAEELGISYDEAHSRLTASGKGKSNGGLLGAIGSILPGKG